MDVPRLILLSAMLDAAKWLRVSRMESHHSLIAANLYSDSNARTALIA
jgi:hypothetical protein